MGTLQCTSSIVISGQSSSSTTWLRIRPDRLDILQPYFTFLCFSVLKQNAEAPPFFFWGGGVLYWWPWPLTFLDEGYILVLLFLEAQANLNGERKYICDICRKSYKRQGNLDNHQQVDHGIEKEASTQNNIKLCSLCSKYFTGMQSLNCHLRRIHGSQENVICSDCGKCFKDKNCLSNHVKNVHMVTNDQCGKCNKICKNKPALEKHMNYNHSWIYKWIVCLNCLN